MGIDVHALNFLRYISRREPLGRVATIGRQSLMIPPGSVSAIMGVPISSGLGVYSEQLLKLHFGADLVDSYDYSDYEGATFTVDMNNPFTPIREYDTVIDCGTLEHIYNVPQAMANVSSLCAAGGRIMHVSPGNNFCGHGFWQFSPELFFSLYCESNGYAETQVFLADVAKPSHWFEVKQPTNGTRAEVTSKAPLYVMCKARKISSGFRVQVQQSDYVHQWQRMQPDESLESGIVRRAKRFVRSKSTLHRMVWHLRHKIHTMRPTQLSDLNPHLNKRDVNELLDA